MPELAIESVSELIEYALWSVAVILLCFYGLFMPLHLVAITFSRLWLYSRSKSSSYHSVTPTKAPDSVETLGQLSGPTSNGFAPVTKNGFVHGKQFTLAESVPRMNGFTHCNGIQPTISLQPQINAEHELGVTIIKPLIGYDPNLKVNLESFFELNYTNYEIIFCIGELRNGPSLPIVQELAALYPTINVRIFQGGEQLGVNPKINNMLPGYRNARFNLIWICDSGIIATPNLLKELTHHLTSDPQIAIVHQLPYVAPVNDLVGYLDKVYFGTHHSRMYILATLANKNCANGMSWLVRKEALEQEGGIEAFREYLAEDFYMNQALLDRGWKSVLSTLPALQNPGNRSFTAFQARVRRWCRLRCTIHPVISRLEPFTECLGLGILGAISTHYLFGFNIFIFFFLHVLFWFCCDLALIKSIENGSVGSLWKIVLIWVIREIWTFPIFLGGACFYSKEVNWRGQQYRLLNGGKAIKLN